MSDARFRILDVDIDALSPQRIAREISGALSDNTVRPLWIVTANPEIVLAAHADASYRLTLSRATHRVADGMGIVLAGLLRGRKLPRVTGGFLLETVFAKAVETKRSVHMILHANGLANEQAVRQYLAERHLTLRLFVSSLLPGDPPLETNGDILITTFGAPMQETWIAAYKDRFGAVRCFLGVGGAVDVYCGIVARPPRLFSLFGLEWLWRLMIQPKRWRRILRAVFLFPAMLLFHHDHS